MVSRKMIVMFLTSALLKGAGQENIPTDSLRLKRITFNTSVFEILPTFLLNTGSINLGSEICMKDRTALYVNAGYLRSYGPSGGWLGISALETKGFKIQLEGKRYLGKHKVVQPAMLVFWPHIFQFHSQKLNNTGFYASIHSFFQFTETLRSQSFTYEATNSNTRRNLVTNSYNVMRRAGGLHLKFGYHCIKIGGLSIDYAIGAGVQIINSESSGKSPFGNEWSENQRDYGGKLFDSGFAIAPSFVYHLRLGFSY